MISKDEILVSVYAKSPIYWGILFIIAALTATYMFRMYYLTFHGTFRGTEEQKHHLHESPFNMTFPLIVLAILSVVGGFFNLPKLIGETPFTEKLAHWIKPVLTPQSWNQQEANMHGVSHNTEYILLGITILMFFGVWMYVKNLYGTKGKLAMAEESYKGWERLSAKKLFVDEIYTLLFVKTVEGLGKAAKSFDKDILDKGVEFVGEGAEDSGKSMKKFQNGNVENYVLIMSLAIGVILIVNFIFQ
jgi:NADH-quinone oxidoreductase subunit L